MSLFFTFSNEQIKEIAYFIFFCSQQDSLLSLPSDGLFLEEDFLYCLKIYTFLNEKNREILISFKDDFFKMLYVVKSFNALFSLHLSKEQILSSLYLFSGQFVELMTGSGKTFAITLACVWFVKLEKRKVHVSTFTEYLSSRDLNELKFFYDALKINSFSVSEIGNNPELLKKADIVYGDMSGFVFLFLNFSIDSYKYNLLIKNLDVIILDESDGILIEKDLNPHILKTNIPLNSGIFSKKNNLLLLSLSDIKEISEYVNKNFIFGKDYRVVQNVDNLKVTLINKGILKIKKIYQVFPLLTNYPSSTFFLILTILQAKYKKINVDYLYDKEDEKIYPINKFTGESDKNSQFANLEHQIIELKYGIFSKDKEKFLFSNSNHTTEANIYTYLRNYQMCLGISGTNSEIKTTIFSLFQRNVVVVEHKFEKQNKVINSSVFLNKKEKMNDLVEQIRSFFPSPILVLTENPVKNRELYSFIKRKVDFLDENNCFFLDAVNEATKRSIIDRKAGKEGNVVFATNIISRGVDIKITHPLEKNFFLFQNHYEKLKNYANAKENTFKCYVYDLIIDLFSFELKSFEKRNKGLVLFLFQPYLDRRLDKQAIGRTARMGKDGTINKMFSFDDTLVQIKKKKVSFFSLTSFYFNLFHFLKFFKKDFSKHIFLLIKRIQNIEYTFISKTSERTRLHDLLINGYIKRIFFELQSDKAKLKSF